MDFDHWYFIILALWFPIWYALEKVWPSPKGWLKRDYVKVVFLVGSVLIASASYFYLIEIGASVSRMIDRLWLMSGDTATDPTEIKDLAYGTAVLIGALVAAATIPFTMLRTWINERQTYAAEQGHITDRINKAVEGLGAEKTVVRLGRNRTYFTNLLRITEFEWHGEPFAFPDDACLPEQRHEQPTELWENISLTVPNLEVRIGAIYALERISQDSERDHIQIMEILCAYIRENAPATDLASDDDLEIRPTPRTDIQTAIRVIGRRSEQCKALEAKERFRLDLRNCDLSGVDFSKKDFSAALFHDSRMEFARFSHSKLNGTQMDGCVLNASNFYAAEMKGTRLVECRISWTPARGRGLEHSNYSGLILAGAKLEGITFLGPPELMKKSFGTKDTVLGGQLGEVWRFLCGEDITLDEAPNADDQQMFENWSRHENAEGWKENPTEKYYQSAGLIDFPFQD